jgi:hypothetical protein
LDADDIMKPKRIELQLQASLEHPDSIIGAKFTRFVAVANVSVIEGARLLAHTRSRDQDPQRLDGAVHALV